MARAMTEEEIRKHPHQCPDHCHRCPLMGGDVMPRCWGSIDRPPRDLSFCTCERPRKADVVEKRLAALEAEVKALREALSLLLGKE